ncbi:bifunctional phosphoribosylaminoimidazolecarboxamide formyltransferase/IMP cyclohydrolase [Anaplasmataceae bacterium AB001_6]|nr:bifunctional phosphoribosylaminoimidazolecarboxamide formyltransferase/IMP cyclohydrolase [Anaplasmataceae bacterium AB001_6]
MRIKRALISVYDKTGIVKLSRYLIENDVEIISTGGTFKLLKENDIPVMEIADFTDFPEILGGRVKTLHPKVHGGILCVPGQFDDDIQQNEIQKIDLVIVNLYPFVDTVNSGASEDEIIENIDIGGVTLIRAAAKNYKNVAVVTDVKQYNDVNVDSSAKLRELWAKQAFFNIAQYDSAISNWFTGSDVLNLNLVKKNDFRYGENPHQKGSFYSNGELPFQKLQGKELSYNNVLDVHAALALIAEFKNEFATVIVKHNNPCGVAVGNDEIESYKKALSCDSRSSFGGVVSVNGHVSETLAREITNIFTEVVIAKSFSSEALDLFNQKPNIRVLCIDHYIEDNFCLRNTLGGILLQDCNNHLYDDFKLAVGDELSEAVKADLIFALKVCKHVKSNAIVLAKDGMTVGIGAGQMSRIDSLELAVTKSVIGTKGAVMASDGFFPFADSVEYAADHNIVAIVQPGGSIKDAEVISKAKDKGITMILTGVRHFVH